MNVARYVLPEDPRKRVEWTLGRIGQLALEGMTDPAVVLRARTIAAEGARAHDTAGEAQALLAWVRQHVRYIGDPLLVETLAGPSHVLRARIGDCDELACLFGSLAMSIGIPVRFVAAKPSPRDAEWRHVWPEVWLGRWVAADPTLPGPLGSRVAPTFEELALPLVAVQGAGGFLSNIFRPIGEVLEQVRDIATLEPARKMLRWSWAHMGEDMRQLVATIGPIVADIYLPGIGGKVSQAALALLEADRVSREQRRKAKAELQRLVDSGQLPAHFDVDNKEHLEAIILASQMPPDVRAQWLRERGMADPAAPATARPPRSAAAAIGLALVASAVMGGNGAAAAGLSL